MILSIIPRPPPVPFVTLGVKVATVRIKGVTLANLNKAARSLNAGGVGFYPESDFVHVDVGRVRYW